MSGTFSFSFYTYRFSNLKSAGGCFEHSYFLLGPLIFAYEALGELKKDSILGIRIRLRIVLFEIHLK